MIKNIMNKSKFIYTLLVVFLLLTNLNSIAYAIEDKDYVFDKGISVVEKENGCILSYKETENSESVFYVEKIEGNFVNTKKFHDKNGNLDLVEEINSIIYKDGETVILKETNVTKGTVERKILGKEINEYHDDSKTERVAVPAGKKRHPLNKNYYFAYSISGHLGFRNLTHGVILATLTTALTGGNIVGGSLSGIATVIANGGYRNIYYKNEIYYPYGTGHKGKPIWKKVTRYYRNSNLTRQIGNTIYTDSDLVSKI